MKIVSDPLIPSTPSDSTVKGTSAGSAGATAPATAPETAAAAAATPPTPAASVQVSVAVAATAPKSPDDVKLLNQIRDQIRNGTFKVDFSKIARGLVDEALAVAGKQRGGQQQAAGG